MTVYMFLILDITMSPPSVRGVLCCSDLAPTHRPDQRLIPLHRATAPTYAEAMMSLGRKVTSLPAWSGWVVKMLHPEQRRELGIVLPVGGAA